MAEHIDAIAVADLVEFLSVAQRLVVLTGAGISTESGIPDFRSTEGLWARHAPPTYHEFMRDADQRRAYWRLRRELWPRVTSAQPNPAHLALAELDRRAILAGIITQNFDGLHQEAGVPPDRIIELHGTSHEAACQSCHARQPIAMVQQRVDAGDEDPRCSCGGYLKAATILFGQPVPATLLEAAITLAESCDLFMVIGSSLRVHPAARLPQIALRRGVPLVILNREPTPLDVRADLVIRATAGPFLGSVLDTLRA